MSSKYQAHRDKWGSCQRCLFCRRRNRVVLARGRVPAQLLLIGESPGASESVIGQPFVGPAGHLLDRILTVAVDGRVDYALTNLVCCIPKLPPPTVVNLRRDEYDVKIDRTTGWGNPFKLNLDGTREEVVKQYAEWLPGQPKLMKKLESLAGQRLGCHCKPKLCHGDMIVEEFKRQFGGKISEPPEWSIKACQPRLEEFISLCSPEKIVAVGRLAAKHLPDADAKIVHPAAILRMDVSQRGLAIQRATVVIEDVVDDLVGK